MTPVLFVSWRFLSGLVRHRPLTKWERPEGMGTTGEVSVRKAGGDAQELADDWFFETAIRLHRAGEGAPYTGMKPAGLDEGPVVPRAEHAIETEDPTDVIQFILHTIEEDLRHRFAQVIQTKKYNPNNVKAGRAFIQAYINFVVYAHHLYITVKGGAGNGGTEHQGGHGH